MKKNELVRSAFVDGMITQRISSIHIKRACLDSLMGTTNSFTRVRNFLKKSMRMGL